MSILVVRSFCFISYYSSLCQHNNVLLQIFFLSLGSRPLLFMIYIYVWIFEHGVKELEHKPWFHWTLRPSLGPVNGQKKEKGGQWKEDKRVEEGKKAPTLLLIFISSTFSATWIFPHRFPKSRHGEKNENWNSFANSIFIAPLMSSRDRRPGDECADHVILQNWKMNSLNFNFNFFLK